MSRTSTEALLFDLGGVVFDIDFERALGHWADHAGVEVDALRPLCRADAWYERHERGEIDAAEYFDSLRQRFGVTLTYAQFVSGWNAIFDGERAGMPDLLGRLGERIPIYAFSNTNATHKQYWEREYAPTLDLFREVFVSCDLGLRKPEAAAFRAVCDAMGVAPERVLFFDDASENVDGARGVGMRAVHVRGIDDVRANVAAFLRSGAG